MIRTFSLFQVFKREPSEFDIFQVLWRMENVKRVNLALMILQNGCGGVNEDASCDH